MRYESFSISIGAATQPGHYPLTVTDSPGGRGRTELVLPEGLTWQDDYGWSCDPCRHGWASLDPAAQDPGTTARNLTTGSDERSATSLRQIGRSLFEALLVPEIRRLYDFSLGRVARTSSEEDDEPCGLRLSICLDPRNPDLGLLCSLPWELLYDPFWQRHLGAELASPIVRRLDLALPVAPRRLKPPLKVLVVAAQPSALAPVGLTGEHRQLVEAWQVQDEVHVELLEHACLADLTERWSTGGFHALHFIGHGGIIPGTDQAAIYLEGDNQDPQPVTGPILASALQAGRLPGLIVLNACKTAHVASGPRTELSAGLASALLSRGVPGVVAMQLPITDAAAITFSAALYRSIAHGEPLDLAMGAGRGAILREHPDSMEWAKPVVYLQKDDARVLEIPAADPVIEPVSGCERPEQVPSEPAERGALHHFQRDLFDLLDDLKIRSLDDVQALGATDRNALCHEILSRIIGLGCTPERLLNLNHINTRFPSKSLLTRPEVIASLETLHRKAALYADHSVVCVPSIRLPSAMSPQQSTQILGEDTISILLQHRELIQTGKMSVVPEVVAQAGQRLRCLFDVKKLQTVKADLQDAAVRSFLLDEGALLKPAGALLFKSPGAGGVGLEEILEIEEQYRPDYERFQAHLRLTMGAINPDDETTAFTHALRAVDDGISHLDSIYNSTRRRRSGRLTGVLASGALAVVLYAVGSEVASFVASTFASASVSSLVSYVPEVQAIPNEIRHSPFFVPWLVHHRARAS